jgi:hypothetical protein
MELNLGPHRGVLILLLSFSGTALADNYYSALASFSSRVNAEAFAAKHQQYQTGLQIRQVERNGSTFYRVIAGPYPTEAAARENVALQRTRGIKGAWLFVEPGAWTPIARQPQGKPAPQPSLETESAIQTAAPVSQKQQPVAAPRQLPSTLLVAAGASDTLSLIRVGKDEIKVDGLLDEPVWQTIPAVDQFVGIEPDTGEPGQYATRLRIAYNESGLFVSGEMEQPVDTLVKRLTGRDVRDNRDSLSVTIDTSGEGRYGYWFGINLGDSLMDGTVLPERLFLSDWDGPWVGRTQTTARGWSAEFFIPWGMVSMPAVEGTRRMGVYVSRKVAHLDERWAWPALPPTQPKFMTALNALEMEDVQPRQQYSIYPFVSSAYDWVEEEAEYRAGADILWRPSSNFQLNATLNPDFGNVESDDVIINLSATETFFPEKRLFFLEGQEIFTASPRADTRTQDVGQRGSPYTMVNTRRIGGKPLAPLVGADVDVPQRERIQQTELIGAVRTTGQAGNFRYGFMGAFEEDVKFDVTEAGVPGRVEQAGNDYGIARLLYEDNARSGAYRAIGVLSTAVLNPDRGDALVQGLDWHYLNSNGKIKIDGQVMSSDLDRTDKRGYGGFLDFELYYADGIRQRIGLEYFDEHIDINDLGFLDRNDAYSVRSSFTWTKSNLSWARENQFDIRGSVRKNISESLTVRQGILLSNRVRLNDLSELTLKFTYSGQTYDDLNSFGNGTYRIEPMATAGIKWQTDTTKPLSLTVGGDYEEDKLGDPGYAGNIGLTWRLGHQYAVEFAVNYKDQEGWLLHQQDDLFATFEAKQWLPSLSLEYYINARQQLRLALQWVGIRAEENKFFQIPAEPDDLIPIAKPTGPGFRDSYDFSVSQYSLQARYRWEIAPLSDLFLVYTRQANLRTALGEAGFNDIFENAWEDPLADLFVVKLRYRFGS